MAEDIGMTIGRFQVPQLHEGHRALVDLLVKNHDRIVIGLGVTPTRGSKRDPMDYVTREAMIRAEYPQATVLPILDSPSDELWSEQIDRMVKALFPLSTVRLYGSRDSFLPCYKGTFPSTMIDPHHYNTGTALRKFVGNHSLPTEDFRRGIIYATQNQFDISYQTVDVAIYKDTDEKSSNKTILLLGRKATEKKFRFVGGFVDPNSDTSLELAAIREAHEETGLEITHPTYIGSTRIDDWRFRGKDKILTALFAAEYIFGGAAKAHDDIMEIKWWELHTLLEQPTLLVDEHHKLLSMLTAHPVATHFRL